MISPRINRWLAQAWQVMRHAGTASYVAACAVTSSSHAVPAQIRQRDGQRRLSLYLRLKYRLDVRKFRKAQDPVSRIADPAHGRANRA